MSPSLKFRRFCNLCLSGGHVIQTTAFSLAWQAEELIPWSNIILSNCSRPEYSARSRCEGASGGRGLGALPPELPPVAWKLLLAAPASAEWSSAGRRASTMATWARTAPPQSHAYSYMDI